MIRPPAAPQERQLVAGHSSLCQVRRQKGAMRRQHGEVQQRVGQAQEPRLTPLVRNNICMYIYISTLWDIIHQCNHNYIAYILSKICFSQTTKSEILREKELRISVYKVVPQFVNAKLVQISPISLWFIGVEVVNGIVTHL